MLRGVGLAQKNFWKFNKEWFSPSHLLVYMRSERFRQIAAIYLTACWDNAEPDYSAVPAEFAEELAFWKRGIAKYGGSAEEVKEWLIDVKIVVFRRGLAWAEVRQLSVEGSKCRFLEGTTEETRTMVDGKEKIEHGAKAPPPPQPLPPPHRHRHHIITIASPPPPPPHHHHHTHTHIGT